MNPRIFVACLAAFAPLSTSLAQNSTGGQPAPNPQGTVLGWRTLKLGMDFESALAAMPDADWSDYSMDRCKRELASQGCRLAQTEDASTDVEGIAFIPGLSFNKHGVLTDIELVYQREGEVTRQQCIGILERAIDIVAAQYGAMAYSQSKPEKGWVLQTGKTSRGIIYALSYNPTEKFTLAQPIRAQIQGVNIPTTLPIARWNDQAFASVSGVFAIVGAAQCRVDISYSLPMKIERRAL